MTTLTHWPSLLTMLAVGMLAGCSQTTKSPDVSDNVRKSLDQANLKSVSVNQDRDKGVVTIGGHVAADAERAQAETIAKSIAGDQVLANQIAVLPLGAESDAKAMNTDLDKGIQQNLDAALIQNKLHGIVKFTVRNLVVTLNGDVDSQARSRDAAGIASTVPNVQQVVNELQIKNQKATSSE